MNACPDLCLPAQTFASLTKQFNCCPTLSLSTRAIQLFPEPSFAACNLAAVTQQPARELYQPSRTCFLLLELCTELPEP